MRGRFSLLHGFVEVVLCISSPLPNKPKLKFDKDFKACCSFCFELKYSMPWACCAFGNVSSKNTRQFIWEIKNPRWGFQSRREGGIVDFSTIFRVGTESLSSPQFLSGQCWKLRKAISYNDDSTNNFIGNVFLPLKNTIRDGGSTAL